MTASFYSFSSGLTLGCQLVEFWESWERSFWYFDLFELSSFFPKVFLKLLLAARLCIPVSDEKNICLMQYANVMQCMILPERKCPCIEFISFILSLLSLPLSQTCHFTSQSFQSLSLSLESISALTLASRVESHHFLFLETNILLVRSFKQETLDFPPSCSRLYNPCVVNKFHMNIEKSLM